MSEPVQSVGEQQHDHMQHSAGPQVASDVNQTNALRPLREKLIQWSSDSFQQPPHPAKFAIVTLVMQSTAYAVAASVLAHSIRVHGTCADLVCFVTPELFSSYLSSEISSEGTQSLSAAERDNYAAMELLLCMFDHVICVSPLTFPVSLCRWTRFDNMYSSWLPSCFTKIYGFRLEAYEKVLFLDADMICLNNFDGIFALPTPFGTLTETSKAGRQTGMVISKSILIDGLRHTYGISGAFFCVQPSVQLFKRALARIEYRLKAVEALAGRPDGYREPQYFEDEGSIVVPTDVSTENLPKQPARRSVGRFNAGPDEQLVSAIFFNAENPADPSTHWTNVSRQYNCLPWLKHRFENGEYPIPGVPSDSPGHPLDAPFTHSRTASRKVFLIHYVTEKPWTVVQNYIKGKAREIWPDIRLWYDLLQAMTLRFAKTDFSGCRVLADQTMHIIAPLLPANAAFMSQCDADRIWAMDQKKHRRGNRGKSNSGVEKPIPRPMQSYRNPSDGRKTQ